MRDDAEIVGDEQHCHVEPVAELAQQAKDLELDGNVERRGRLVGDQDVRPAGKRDCDHDALAHPAGKLVRIGAHLKRRIGDADHLKKLARTRKRSDAREAVVDPNRLRDLVVDPQDRIERGHRLLEDHGNVAVAGFDPLPRLRIGDVDAIELDRARPNPGAGLRQQAHDGE